MTIEKRGNSYRATIQIDKKRYRATFDHQPTEAEMMIAISKQMLDNNKSSDTTPFKDCIAKYIEDRTNTASPTTIKGYKDIEKVLPARLMDMHVKDVDQAIVQSVINELAATRAPKTIRNIHGLVSAVLKIYRPELILKTSLPAKIKNDFYIPTDDEIKALREYAKGSVYEVAFLLGCNALRRSEICALDVKTDVDAVNNIIHINKAKVLNADKKWIIKNITKTTEGKRDIEVSPQIIQLLIEKGVAYEGCPNNLTHWIKEAETKLGINEFSFHKLRHYYASTAHALGVPDLYIQKQGGWASTEVLKSIYQHTLERTAQKESEKVRNYLSNVLFENATSGNVKE